MSMGLATNNYHTGHLSIRKRYLPHLKVTSYWFVFVLPFHSGNLKITDILRSPDCIHYGHVLQEDLLTKCLDN